jgi:hypothetical protein
MRGEIAMFAKHVRFLLFACAAMWAGHAQAWGPDGHAIITEIAELRLEPAARAQVASLLRGKRLEEIASWADDYRTTHRETGPWHFVDIPLDAGGYDPARDCAGGNCVTYQIHRLAAVLGDPRANPTDRQYALMFIVHFVGDIHQPLHCETDFSKFPPPEGDQGGNKVNLTYLGKSAKFHAVWDSYIIDRALNIKRQGGDFQPLLAVTRPAARRLSDRIPLAAAAAWAPDGLAANIGVVTVQWANESHAVALIAYDDLPPAGRRRSGWDRRYQAKAWPIVQEQLQRGGVRLAKLLNETLR